MAPDQARQPANHHNNQADQARALRPDHHQDNNRKPIYEQIFHTHPR